MSHMIGYIGGDRDTYALRAAKRGDLKVAVEWPDHNRMLAIIIGQDGDVLVGFTPITGAPPLRDMMHVATVVGVGDGDIDFPEIKYVGEVIEITTEKPVVEFTHLQAVPNEYIESDDDD